MADKMKVTDSVFELREEWPASVGGDELFEAVANIEGKKGELCFVVKDDVTLIAISVTPEQWKALVKFGNHWAGVEE